MTESVRQTLNEALANRLNRRADYALQIEKAARELAEWEAAAAKNNAAIAELEEALGEAPEGVILFIDKETGEKI